MITPKNKEIADQLFKLANDLSGEETGHLAGVIHCVVSELYAGGDVFRKLDELRGQLNMIKHLQSLMPDATTTPG